jgi:hypothetical protein
VRKRCGIWVKAVDQGETEILSRKAVDAKKSCRTTMIRREGRGALKLKWVPKDNGINSKRHRFVRNGELLQIGFDLQSRER